MLFLIFIYIFFCLLIWHQLRITYKYKKKCINDIESINSRFFLFLFLILSNFFRLIFFLYIYFFYYYDYVLIIDLHKPTSYNIKLHDSYIRNNFPSDDFVNSSFINNIHESNNLLKFLKKENEFDIKKREKEKLNFLYNVEKEKKGKFSIIHNEKQKISNNDKLYKKHNSYNLLRKMQNIKINDFYEALEDKEIDHLNRVHNNDMYNKNISKDNNLVLGNEYFLFKNKNINGSKIKEEKLHKACITTDTSSKQENNLNHFIDKNLNVISWDCHSENESFQYDNSSKENKNMKDGFLKYATSKEMNKLITDSFKIEEKNNKTNNKIYSKINDNNIISEKIINNVNSEFHDLKLNEENVTKKPSTEDYIVNINKNENYPEKDEVANSFSKNFIDFTEQKDINMDDNVIKENNNKEILYIKENSDMKTIKNEVSNSIKELKEGNNNKNIASVYSTNSNEEHEDNKKEYENYILINKNKKNKTRSDKNELLIRIHKSNEKNLLLWIYLFLNFLPSLFYISSYSIILSLIIKVYYIFILKSDTIFKQALFYGNILLYFLFISILFFTFVTSIYLYKAYVLILLTIYYFILAILLCYFGNKLLIHLNMRNKYYGIKEIDTYIVPLRHKKDNVKRCRKYKLKTTNNVKNYFYKIQEKLFNRKIHANTRKDLELNIFILVSFISFILVLNGTFNIYMAYHIIRTYMNYSYIKKIHIYLYIYLISEFIPNICIFLTYWSKKIDNKSYFSNNVNLLYQINNTIYKNNTVYEKNYKDKNIKQLCNDSINSDFYEEFHSN